MPASNSDTVRERNFTDPEAHAFIALLRKEAGWRETDVSLATWGVRPERYQALMDEAARLVEDIRRQGPDA